MDDQPASRPARPSATSAQNANQNAPKVQQPTVQQPKVQQPKPQALPSRSGPSSILVSPRQKGNPILTSVRNVAWEFSDIAADYVLGATTCALFLSLKYHRLHPEYIYNRIRDLKGQYQLRILLTMVDIENHEDSLRELSKTSLINNVNIILAWSAQEAGRYLELFKTFEHAAPTSIRAHQSESYSDKLIEFITVPRSINKTDALGLVSNFGSVRTAINAGPEEIGLIAGWGEKKVQRWCNAAREPFRLKKAAKRGITRENTTAEGADPMLDDEAEVPLNPSVDDAVLSAVNMAETVPTAAASDADKRLDHRVAEDLNMTHSNKEQDIVQQANLEGSANQLPAQVQSQGASSTAKKRGLDDESMSDGIMAALNKLRQK